MDGTEVNELFPFRHDPNDTHCKLHGTDLYPACPECYQEEVTRRLLGFKALCSENSKLRAMVRAAAKHVLAYERTCCAIESAPEVSRWIRECVDYFWETEVG